MECNPIFLVIMEDENVHTVERPFCDDMTCPCHEDATLFFFCISSPIARGELTEAEGKRLWEGKQI